MNKVIDSCRFVVVNSTQVKIDKQKINEFCESFDINDICHWFKYAPFDIYNLNNKDRLCFLFVFNAISFRYWGDPKWKIFYKNNEYDGAWAMIASIGRAVENGVPILNSDYLANITFEQLDKILQGNIKIPLFEQRLEILRELGNCLQKYDNDFFNLIEQAQNDMQKLLDLIVANIPSFADHTLYKGGEVYFYKRAQLLIADICNSFLDGFSKNFNISELTACADYKLPFVLNRLGILKYTQELEFKLKNKMLIEKNCEQEIEIRAATVWAVELLKQNLQSKYPQICSAYLNDYLWLLGQKKTVNDLPYHLTETIYY